MNHRLPIALAIAALAAACATPPEQKSQADTQAAPPARAATPAPRPEAPPAAPALSPALRNRLGNSGAEMADGPDGSVRLTLPGAVAFTSGSKAVSPAAQPILDRIAEALTANPGWRVTVEGHTDSAGREIYNQELSRQRAESVMNHMVGRGVDASRIGAEGRGESAPVADNATAKGRAANRRIEIIVTPAGR